MNDVEEEISGHQNFIISGIGGGIAGYTIGNLAEGSPKQTGILSGLIGAGLLAHKQDNTVLSLLGGGVTGYIVYSLSKDTPAFIGLSSGMITFVGLYRYVLGGEEKSKEEKSILERHGYE